VKTENKDENVSIKRDNGEEKRKRCGGLRREKKEKAKKIDMLGSVLFKATIKKKLPSKSGEKEKTQ